MICKRLFSTAQTTAPKSKMNMFQAINDAMRIALEKDPSASKEASLKSPFTFNFSIVWRRCRLWRGI